MSFLNCSKKKKEKKEKSGAFEKKEAKDAKDLEKKVKQGPKKIKKANPEKPAPTKQPREKMKEGDVINSKKFSWKIGNLLGAGGFGDVYKVTKENHSDKKEYAMKTEMVDGNEMMLRLKVEVEVLADCNRITNLEKKKHFVPMEDKGKTEKFKFVVMGLVGRSIYDYRKKKLFGDYTEASAVNAAMQTYEGVRDLHDAGWLHRDIKPQNFAFGRGASAHLVYILDFGIAKRAFIKGTTQQKQPRKSVRFVGTVRFASRACHLGMEQSRKDDIESWIYMAVDIFDRVNGLPWNGIKKRRTVHELKRKFSKHYAEKPSKCPKEIFEILNYIEGLGYWHLPSYSFISDIMAKMIKRIGVNMGDKPEWAVEENEP